MEPNAHADLSPLGRRERELARLVAEGRSDEEIAGLLATGAAGVRVDLDDLLARLGLRSRTELALLAALVSGDGHVDSR